MKVGLLVVGRKVKGNAISFVRRCSNLTKSEKLAYFKLLEDDEDEQIRLWAKELVLEFEENTNGSLK